MEGIADFQVADQAIAQADRLLSGGAFVVSGETPAEPSTLPPIQLVFLDARLPHERGVGREPLDQRVRRELEHRLAVGPVGKNLDPARISSLELHAGDYGIPGGEELKGPVLGAIVGMYGDQFLTVF